MYTYPSRPASIRCLKGGSGLSPACGPCIVHRPYFTTANGWADSIEAYPGEVAVCIKPGSPERFAKWLVGPIPDMISYLRSFTGDDAKAQWAHGMAAEIEAHVNDRTPIARFAHALNIPPEKIAEMAILSKVKIVED
jgi:hypothetical protein